MHDPINRALTLVPDTREVLIGPGSIGQLPTVVTRLLGEHAVRVVADTLTYDVAGAAVDELLRASGLPTQHPIILPGVPTLRASQENVERVRSALADSPAVAIAVGSGTLNDLTKRASYLLDRPYLVVATAPSMDGYTAFAAPITVDGFKTSLPCPAPLALIADPQILASAPPAMAASGYGDLLGKITAGACWLVADAAGAEPVDEQVWQFLQDPFRQALATPEALPGGAPAGLARLLEGLVLSGLTIQMYASSRPGSGMEHLLSHLWEMQGLGQHLDPPLSHGMKVGVGSVAAAALYEQVLRMDLDTLDTAALLERWPTPEQARQRTRDLLSAPRLTEAAVEQTMAKYLDVDAARERLHRIRRRWPRLREQLRAQLLPARQFQDMLRAAGAPAHPADIGLSMTELRTAYLQAQVIRSRYTLLDLAHETGVLEPALDRLFAPTGFWGAQDRARSRGHR